MNLTYIPKNIPGMYIYLFFNFLIFSFIRLFIYLFIFLWIDLLIF